jgi:tetratricopeptide (TPR) repeat protein
LPRSGLTVALLLIVACSQDSPKGVPLPPDWALIAPEVRPLVEAAADRCRKHPSDAETFAALGRLYHGNEAFALAAASYDRALALRGSDAKTLYFLGLIREQLGETARALEMFSRARELEPGYAPLRYHLGNVLLDAGRPKEAEEEFREAARLDGPRVEYGVGLARALRQAGSIPEALVAIEAALERWPGDPGANQVGALILKELGRRDGAASRLAKVRTHRAGIVRDPWFREHVQRLGATVSGKLTQAEFFIEAGKAGHAVAILEPLARSMARADVHFQLARALALAGQAKRAREALDRAVEIDPADARIRAELASVLLDFGDVQGALRHAEAAVEADPGLDHARVVRSHARLKNGDVGGALADAASVTTANPGDLQAQVLRGDALLALGRPVDAVAAFEAALKVDPSFVYARGRLAAARAAAGKAGGR